MTSSGLMGRILKHLEAGPRTEISLAAQMGMDTANLRRALRDMEGLCLTIKEDGAWRKTRLI